jgi:hypothetical protein
MVPLGAAQVAAQVGHEAVARAVRLPGAEGPGHDRPGGQVVRPGPPRAAGAGDVEQGVDDRGAVGLGGSATGCRGRDEAGDLGPLGAAQVAGVGASCVQTGR